jgi:hypothetical protein
LTTELSITRQGYRTFDPGYYTYDFEVPLDSHIPETIEVDSGSVKYELKAIVERKGAFCADLVGSRNVTLVRTPAQASLEQFEPITINQRLKDGVCINIIVSSKSSPLGAQIPVLFRITPLAEVQLHWIKVFATEHTKYSCLEKRVHRMGAVRKIKLFEKFLDAPPTSASSGNLERTVSDGICTFNRNSTTSKAPTERPMGALSGVDSISTTQIKFLVQLPSYHNLKDNDKALRLHSDTTYQNIQVRHWIKVDRLLNVALVDLT